MRKYCIDKPQSDDSYFVLTLKCLTLFIVCWLTSAGRFSTFG
jgi:hypothetical protein